MALVKGVNSYVTVAEADDYFVDRYGASAWSSASAEEKAQALISATSILDSQTWTGVAISDTQYLAFPRSGTYFDPKYGAVLELSEIEPPDRILQANKELALHLLNNSEILIESDTVRSIGVGQIRLDMVNPPSTISATVKTLIRPLLENTGSSSWWRAN